MIRYFADEIQSKTPPETLNKFTRDLMPSGILSTNNVRLRNFHLTTDSR